MDTLSKPINSNSAVVESDEYDSPKDLLGKWTPPSVIEKLNDECDLVWERMQMVNKDNVKLTLKIQYLTQRLKTVYGALAIENLDLQAAVARLERKK